MIEVFLFSKYHLNKGDILENCMKMTENVDLLKKKFFSHEITCDEINSIDKNDYVLLFSAETYHSKHDFGRIQFFDSIVELLIRYFNLNESDSGLYIVHSNLLPSEITGSKRYLFHGGDKGRFDGMFSNNDKFILIRASKNDHRTADSIPRWNMAHFFCDYLDTKKKSSDFVEWVFSEYCWMDSLHMKLNTYKFLNNI